MTRWVTEADHNKTIEINKDDVIAVRLPENPTTGYRWSVDQHDPSVLEPVQPSSFESAGTAVGAGGGRVFTFVARNAGQSDLVMNLRRPWEAGAAAQKNFCARIRIS